MGKTTDIVSGKVVSKYNLASAIMCTLTTVGPIGWFFIDLTGKVYDRLWFEFVVSLIMVPLTINRWQSWYRFRQSEAFVDADEVDEK